MAEAEDDDGEWEVLCRMHDPVAAGALVSLLDAEKIPSATPGLAHRGMLGVLGAYVEIVVSVPRAELERARTLLAALDAPPDGAPVEDGAKGKAAVGTPAEDGAKGTAAVGTPDGSAEPRPRPPRGEAAAPDRDAPAGERPRQRRVAAFVSFALTFGAGHFYVRDAVGGWILLLAEVTTLACAFLGAPLVALALPVVVLCDAIGAQLSISRLRDGASPVAMGRALPLLAAGAVALAPVVRATSPETLAAPAGVVACEIVAECGGAARMLCIERLADQRMAGALTAEALEACAECLEPTHTCEEVEACGPACALALPVPRRPLPPRIRESDDDFLRMVGELPGVSDEMLERARESEEPRRD